MKTFILVTPEGETLAVKANIIRGDYAIHRPIGFENLPSKDIHYTLTHIPTGFRIKKEWIMADLKPLLIKLAEAPTKFDKSFKDPVKSEIMSEYLKPFVFPDR